jgi:hypothetical protein
MGTYVCTASNGIPPVASRRITVNINCKYQQYFDILKWYKFQKSNIKNCKFILNIVNPVINVPNQLIWSTQGNNFTMECNVEAFPRSVNYWIRGDGISYFKFIQQI